MTSLEWKYIDKVNREGRIEGCKWLFFLPTWHKSKGEWMKVKVKKEKFLPVDARWCNWCIWSQLIHSKWLLLTMESLLWKVPARTDFLGQWATNQNNSKNRKPMKTWKSKLSNDISCTIDVHSMSIQVQLKSLTKSFTKVEIYSLPSELSFLLPTWIQRRTFPIHAR